MEASNPQQFNVNNPLPSADATQRIQQLWLECRKEITELEANNNLKHNMRWNDFMHGIATDPMQQPMSFYKLFMEVFDITKNECRDEVVDSNNKKLIKEIEAWRKDVKIYNMSSPGVFHMQLIETGIELFNKWEQPMLSKGLICIVRKKK
jgi:uncharacterized protein (DUF2267 family)